MILEEKEGTWIQCTHCGEIYYINQKVPIDKMYVALVCPRCECGTGLNCGSDEEEIYCFYNPNLDERFYQY